MTLPIQRIERRAKPQRIPRPIQGQHGLVQVDTTWGTIQPAQVAESVRMVGELEVIEYLEQGLPEAGYPPEKILYYRGGLHDWLTLGLPVLPGDGNAQPSQSLS